MHLMLKNGQTYLRNLVVFTYILLSYIYDLKSFSYNNLQVLFAMISVVVVCNELFGMILYLYIIWNDSLITIL